jgi:hypothetical protein
MKALRMKTAIPQEGKEQGKGQSKGTTGQGPSPDAGKTILEEDPDNLPDDEPDLSRAVWCCHKGKMGEMLRETERKGAAGIGKSKSAVPKGYSTQPPTIEELGVTRKEASDAQMLAALPVFAPARERVEIEDHY